MGKTKIVEFGRMVNRNGESELTNRELIDGLIGGDTSAASVFHHRYSARICRWVWRLLGTDRDHDDVVQQVFVSIFQSISRIKKIESLDSWVDSVTIKTVRCELRKRKVRRAFFPNRTETSPDDTQDRNSPFKQGHIRRFYEILGSMPADDRIVFVLRFVEGRSIDEIAAIGKYSPSTAKRRLRRAKALFKKKALRDFTLVSLVEEGYAV